MSRKFSLATRRRFVPWVSSVTGSYFVFTVALRGKNTHRLLYASQCTAWMHVTTPTVLPVSTRCH